MNDTPLVSIGIPTYDRPDMLAAALRGAMEQTYEHIEILVADEGANPETETVVREIAGNDPRVTYERNERTLGGYDNGIKVLTWASGEFQKMLLDDDLIEPHYVETLVAPMIDDPTITMAFSKRRIIDEFGILLPDPPGMSAIAEQSGRIPSQALFNLCTSTTSNWIGEQSTVLYRRSVVNHRLPFVFAGSRPSGVMADLGMHYSALARGDAWYTPEPLSSFRQHEGQYSNDDSIHLLALGDWVMYLERMHLVGMPPAPEELIKNFGRIVSAFGNNLAITPHVAASDRSQDLLERAVAHLRSLRETGRLYEEVRVSIVVTAAGDAPHLLPQLEAIIDASPSDAFEVVIVTVEPSESVRTLLGALEGDIQIVAADTVDEAARIGASHAQHAIVTHLGSEDRPVRGWIAELLDARELDEHFGAAE